MKKNLKNNLGWQKIFKQGPRRWFRPRAPQSLKPPLAIAAGSTLKQDFKALPESSFSMFKAVYIILYIRGGKTTARYGAQYDPWEPAAK